MADEFATGLANDMVQTAVQSGDPEGRNFNNGVVQYVADNSGNQAVQTTPVVQPAPDNGKQADQASGGANPGAYNSFTNSVPKFTPDPSFQQDIYNSRINAAENTAAAAQQQAISAQQKADAAANTAADAKGTFLGDLGADLAGKAAEGVGWATLGTELTDNPFIGAAAGVVGPVVTSAVKHWDQLSNGVQNYFNTLPSWGEVPSSPGVPAYTPPVPTMW